jgi:hypothetical protein
VALLIREFSSLFILLFLFFLFSLHPKKDPDTAHVTIFFFWKSDLHIANSRTFTISWFRIYFYYYFGADTFEMIPYICRNGHLIFFQIFHAILEWKMNKNSETYSLCTTIGCTTTTKYQTVVVSQKKKKKERGVLYLAFTLPTPPPFSRLCVYKSSLCLILSLCVVLCCVHFTWPGFSHLILNFSIFSA